MPDNPRYIELNTGYIQVYPDGSSEPSKLIFRIPIISEDDRDCDQVHVYLKEEDTEIRILKITIDTMFAGWDGAFWCVDQCIGDEDFLHVKKITDICEESPIRSLGACIQFLLSKEQDILDAFHEGVYICMQCSGSGRDPRAIACPVCNATGRVAKPSATNIPRLENNET